MAIGIHCLKPLMCYASRTVLHFGHCTRRVETPSPPMMEVINHSPTCLQFGQTISGINRMLLISWASLDIARPLLQITASVRSTRLPASHEVHLRFCDVALDNP